MIDLQRHYDSYMECVTNDALEGSSDFATKQPVKGYASFQDYIRRTTFFIKEAIKARDVQSYQTHLKNHQEALIQLFELMVERTIPKFKSEGETVNAILDKGLKWFRFSNAKVKFDKYTWIPRYAEKFEEIYNPKWPVLSTSEMEAVINFSFDLNEAEKLLEMKKERGLLVVTGMNNKRQVHCFSPKTINQDYIREWTLRLFP